MGYTNAQTNERLPKHLFRHTFRHTETMCTIVVGGASTSDDRTTHERMRSWRDLTDDDQLVYVNNVIKGKLLAVPRA